jgi:hypothetical protein
LNEYQKYLPVLTSTKLAAGAPTPDEQLIDLLTTTGEYFQRVGNTNATWAASMYVNVIGRASADPQGPEVAGWVSFILGQYAATRQSVATTVANSSEHRARVIAGYYQTFLGRAAGAFEIQSWLKQTQAGLTDQQVLAAIVSSPEFFPTSGAGSSNATWIAKIYTDLLNRSSANDNQANQYLAYLNSVPTAQTQQARQTVALEILASTEYLSDLVASFYNKYLGRNKPIPANQADPELVGWVALLKKGATEEQVVAGILGSAEFFVAPHTFP